MPSWGAIWLRRECPYMDPSSVASTPSFGFEVRLLTYIRLFERLELPNPAPTAEDFSVELTSWSA